MASHPNQPNEQRRRLLKAASAAPIIFTLPVGSSVAAGSVFCADPEMGNTIDNIQIIANGTKVKIGSQNYDVTNGTVQVGEQVYVIDDLGNLPPRLVTHSCWNSVFASAASSSTNIV